MRSKGTAGTPSTCKTGMPRPPVGLANTEPPAPAMSKAERSSSRSRENSCRRPFVLLAVLVPFVGRGGLMLMAADRSRYRRSLELARHADAWCLKFAQWHPRQSYEFLGDFRLFRNPTQDSATNFMSGPTDDG